MKKLILWELLKEYGHWEAYQQDYHPWLTRMRYMVSGSFAYVVAMAFGWIK